MAEGAREEPKLSEHIMSMAERVGGDIVRGVAEQMFARLLETLMMQECPWNPDDTGKYFAREAYKALVEKAGDIASKHTGLIEAMQASIWFDPKLTEEGAVHLLVRFLESTLGDMCSSNGLSREDCEAFYDLAVEVAETLEPSLVLLQTPQVVEIGGRYHAREELSGILSAALALAAEVEELLPATRIAQLHLQDHRHELGSVTATAKPIKLILVGFSGEKIEFTFRITGTSLN